MVAESGADLCKDVHPERCTMGNEQLVISSFWVVTEMAWDDFDLKIELLEVSAFDFDVEGHTCLQ